MFIFFVCVIYYIAALAERSFGHPSHVQCDVNPPPLPHDKGIMFSCFFFVQNSIFFISVLFTGAPQPNADPDDKLVNHHILLCVVVPAAGQYFIVFFYIFFEICLFS